jgi:hypothetical protein
MRWIFIYPNKLKSWFSAASTVLQLFRPRLGPCLLALPLALAKKFAASPCRIPNFSVCLGIFFALIASTVGYAHELRCEPELQDVLDKVQCLPEGAEVVQKVLDQGPLSIELNRHLSYQFDGYWDSYNRAIYISKTEESSDCFLVTALLFELHNALHTTDIEHMYSLASKRAIGREQFIEEFEYLEYKNALATSQLLDKGACNGCFPCDCNWDMAPDFATHFEVQLRKGHSASIGAIYDQLAFN